MRIEPENESYIEAVLKQYESLSIVFDALDMGVCVIDVDYKIRCCNKKFQTISGISIEEARGKHCKDVFGNHECHSKCRIKQLCENGKIDSTDLVMSCTGELDSYIVVPLAIKDERGHCAGLADLYIESKEFNFALKEYIELFEEVPVGIWEADYAGFKQFVDDLRSSGIENIEQYLADNIEKLRFIICHKTDVVDDKTYADSEEGDHGEQIVWKDLQKKYPLNKGYKVI